MRLFSPFNVISYSLGPLVCCSGECLVYGFDDLTGALQLSHKLVLSSKDYPGILYTTMNCHVCTTLYYCLFSDNLGLK